MGGDKYSKLGFVGMFGTRPDEGIGPYKMHTVGPRALTGPPLPRFNYPDKPQFVHILPGLIRTLTFPLCSAKISKTERRGQP